MLFKAEEVGMGLQFNEASAILEDAEYISTPILAPNTVAVVESAEWGCGVVRFADVEALAEDSGCDYISAMSSIAASNGIGLDQLAVAVDEADIILDPDIVTELCNVVVKPMTESHIAYQYCEALLEAYLETGDDGYLGIIAEANDVATQRARIDTMERELANNMEAAKNMSQSDPTYKKLQQDIMKRQQKLKVAKATLTSLIQSDKNVANATDPKTGRVNQGKLGGGGYKASGVGADDTQKPGLLGRIGGAIKSGASSALQTAGNNKGKIAAGLAVGGALALGAKKAYDHFNAAKIEKEAENKPKSWIAQKIAALRKMYSNWLQKAQAESDAGKAGMFKKIAAKIMAVIDKLMAKMQHAAG